MNTDGEPTDSSGMRLTRAQLLSFGGTVLVAIGGLFIFVIQRFIESAVGASFHRNIKELDLALERRSVFEDRVLTDRYERAMDLIGRSDEVLITYRRARRGNTPPKGFVTQPGVPAGSEIDCAKPREIVPLTEVYRDLEIYRLLLGKNLHRLLFDRAAIALGAADLALCPPIADLETWNRRVDGPWLALNEQLRTELDAQFGLSQIRYDVSLTPTTIPEASPTPTMGS
jgi:hypothetical protein